MKINLDSPSDDIRIEIVPLIDVIFCILTFFILAALQFTRQQAISVDLPKATTGTTPQMADRLIVRVDPPFGQVYVDDGVNQPEPMIGKDQLIERLQQYSQAKPDGMLVLYASRDVRYNDVVQVLDLMRQVGRDRVALATLPETTNQVPGATPLVPPGTGIPGLPAAPGTTPAIPYNPYGTTPTTPFNPNQPQYPSAPGQLPGQPGINPVTPGTGTLTPTIPPSGGVPTPPTTTVPTPGATVSPSIPSGQN
jgi:biopolymer transport protein ExbD